MTLIEPHLPKTGWPLAVKLRGYFLRNWHCSSDPMTEETQYDSEPMRRFAGIKRDCDRIPEQTTILKIRHLPERHRRSEAIFAAVNAYLTDKASRCARARGSTRHPRPKTR